MGPARGGGTHDDPAGSCGRSAPRWVAQWGVPVKREDEPLQSRSLRVYQPVEHEPVEHQPVEHALDRESNAFVFIADPEFVERGAHEHQSGEHRAHLRPAHIHPPHE